MPELAITEDFIWGQLMLKIALMSLAYKTNKSYKYDVEIPHIPQVLRPILNLNYFDKFEAFFCILNSKILWRKTFMPRALLLHKISQKMPSLSRPLSLSVWISHEKKAQNLNLWALNMTRQVFV